MFGQTSFPFEPFFLFVYSPLSGLILFYIVLHLTFVLSESELTLEALSKLKSHTFFVELHVNIKYECINSLSRPAADRQLFFQVSTFLNFLFYWNLTAILKFLESNLNVTLNLTKLVELIATDRWKFNLVTKNDFIFFIGITFSGTPKTADPDLWTQSNG